MAINFDHTNNVITTTNSKLAFSITGAVTIPVGTTGQRPGSPVTGDLRYNSTLATFEGFTNVWGEIGGSVATNLGYTTAASSGTVTSSDGTDATLPAATTLLAGLLTGTDKTKLDGIETSATADQTAGEIEAIVDHDNLIGFVTNEHIDWTTDQGATNIHANNYTDTTYVSSDFDHNALTNYVAAEHIDWALTNAANIHPDNYTDTDTTYVSSDFDHNALTNYVSAQHIDWASTNAANIHPDNYTDTDTTYVSSDFNHDNLTGFVANEHIDWTTDQGATNIHANNYTDTDTTYVSSDFNHDNLTGFVANEHIDWTTDQGATNINAGNYTDTIYTHPSDGVDLGAALTGANVISDVTVNTAGHVTGFATRALTASDVGATATGHTHVAANITDFDTEVANNSAVTANTAKVSNVTTNLGYTTAASTGTVTSSDGTDATLPAATISLAGLLTSTDKTKLNGIEALADVTDATNVNAAGAVMNSDTTTAAMSFVIDEDTLISNSATKLPTQQSVKQYVDNIVASSVVYNGGYNASTNAPNLDTSPTGVTIGDMYTVTVAGTFYTLALQVGDVLIAEANDPTLETQWTVVNKNLDSPSIKISYESNADTNAFTDAEQTKLTGIETSATADQTAGEIEAIVDHDNLIGFVANEHIDWTTDQGATNINAGNYTDTNTTYVSSDFDHDNLTGFVANEHIDWTTDQGATNINAGNYTDTTYVSSDFDHDALTGFVANEHIDWTTDQGATNIHAGNYTDTNTTYVSSDFNHDNLTGFVANEHIDWTTDQGATNIHAGNYTDTNTTYVSSDFNHDNLTGFVANEHIDWTADQGATNINAGNYTDTVYTHPSDGVDLGAALTGANVISDVTVNTAGHVTGFATRAMTASDVGAIPAGDIVLGTETSGAYVQQGATSGNGLSGSVNSEGGTFTVTSNATAANTANTTVFRNASGNFSAGTVFADLSGNATTATTWATGRTITLTGDITGTSASFNGSGNLSFATTIAANSVALGTDTTGNYVATITGTTNEIEVTGSGSETAGVTIGLPNAVTISGAMTAGSFIGDGSGLTNVNAVDITPPGSPVLGDIWYNSQSGGLFIYYTDATPDSYWVQVGGADGAGTAGSSGASPFVDTGTYVYYGGPRHVGIGIAAPTEALHVIGNILASEDVTAYSDESLKTDISTISGAINIVTQLRGVNYTKKSTQRASIGVIAQEVQKILPSVVHADPETGLLSVAYGNMVGVLIEAIKEQQNEIVELKQQMNDMMIRLDKLDGSN